MALKKPKTVPPEGSELRRLAEERLCTKTVKPHSSLSREDTRRVVHELEVHQIELEMQNEELCRAHEELVESRDQFFELYDYAPVAYLTLDVRGVIREVNLTGCHLLGIERTLLLGRPFSGMIADTNGRKVFSEHLALVRQRKVMLSCEIGLTSKDGTLIHGRIQSVAVAGGDKEGRILVSIVDATVRKLLEEKLQQAHDRLEQTVEERTAELFRSNVLLQQEIEERTLAETSVRNAYAEIKQLKDRLLAENIYLQKEIARNDNFGEIVGNGKSISYVFSQVEQVAPMNATVLLLGETGTGKGVIARAIHSSSTRKGRAMITVNCTTLPSNLIESELFGRERGAFTGSDARQIGRFELADGGTIFLDEIGELPLEMQAKLLRVIQDGEFERLGSPRTIKINVRIIAATNRNLEEEVRNKRFREDLFYRLNVFPITVPPLRQRREDIPQLVNHFVAKFNKKIGKNIETVSKETLRIFQEYSWPGNVRELESVIERAVIISQGSVLQVLDRFVTLRKEEELVEQDIRTLVEMEHDQILRILKKTGWRIEGDTGAALLLGLNASTLRARMRKFGIVRV